MSSQHTGRSKKETILTIGYREPQNIVSRHECRTVKDLTTDSESYSICDIQEKFRNVIYEFDSMYVCLLTHINTVTLT